MEALSNLVSNCPDWVQRLDELNGQIEQRQIELAQFAEQHSPDSSAGRPKSVRSVKHRGSTESLKPKGEPQAHPASPPTGTPPAPAPAPADPMGTNEHARLPSSHADRHEVPEAPSSPEPTPSVLERQTHHVMAVAQAKARATLRKSHGHGKRPRATDSILSAEGQMSKYRSRNMIIVYYDSYVQSFFEELVKFVSASRNLMRKAKMAAKVAQIKRMAELEMPDDDDDSGSGDEEVAGQSNLNLAASATTSPLLRPDAPLPLHAAADATMPSSAQPRAAATPASPQTGARRATAMNTLSTYASGRPSYFRAAMASYGAGPRSMAFSGIGAFGDQQPDIYDDLDKGLEFVQSMCEHAAHQFLRDGDCAEEIEKIKSRLTETKEMAAREMEKIFEQDPDALKAAEEPTRSRNYRPQSMRREAFQSASATVKVQERAAGKAPNTNNSTSNETLEVDEGIDDMDESVPPKLVYKSTRAMGSRGGPSNP